MNTKIIFKAAIITIITLSSCGTKTDNKTTSSSNSQAKATHPVTTYWEKYSFSSPTWTNANDSIEQAFVDYIALFPRTTSEIIGESISELLHSALKEKKELYQNFTNLFDKYLYDPNSPFRQDEYYILVLQAIINSPMIEDVEKIGPRARLTIALQNRVGEKAADFSFTEKSGKQSRLTDIYAEFILIFFNNPDCHDCSRVKNYILSSSVIDKLSKFDGKTTLKILAIYPDEDLNIWKKTTYPTNWINGRSSQVNAEQLYDLKAIPSLYLLDKDKRVLLKDAPIEQIEAYLSNIR